MNSFDIEKSLSSLGRRTTEPPISWLMEQALSQPGLISLAAGFTDNPSLPVSEARSILEEILSTNETAQAALQYGTTSGDRNLRRLTVERMARQDREALQVMKQAPAAEPDSSVYDLDRLLITHGSQQLLYLITEILCDPGDIVLVEDPTYFVYLGIAQSHGIDCRGIRMSPHGVDAEHLEEVLEGLKKSGSLPRLKMLYLVSYHQNPSGITGSFESKSKALELLRQYESDAGHPLFLLEDAAYRDLKFAGPEMPSALALPEAGHRVIYTSTYSKPFATGIRVGYGLLPEPLAKTASRVKGNHDFGTAHILQKILSRAIESGRFEAHVTELRQRYAHKAAVMRSALESHCRGLLEWDDAEGGLYFWARLPEGIQSGPQSPLFEAALERKVLYVPGRLCYAEDPSREQPDNELRLSFGNAGEEQLADGIERLAKAIRDVRR